LELPLVAIFSKDTSSADASNGRGTSRESTLSIIAADMTVLGDVECSGVLKIEGRVNGSVRNARQVMLARDGSIHGDATGQEIVLGGLVDGNVVASERLELQSTAIINGDIATKSIVVMEGARINGSVKMTDISLVADGSPKLRDASRIAR
jgi:cytoskeletal protein CcmA (bactofilin family)